jgi:hypothetical protein
MMVVPKYADVDKTESVGQEHRQTGLQCCEIGPLGHLQFQHHYRDDDGDHTVRERFQPLPTHRCPQSSFVIVAFAGRVPAYADAVLMNCRTVRYSNIQEEDFNAACRHRLLR